MKFLTVAVILCLILGVGFIYSNYQNSKQNGEVRSNCPNFNGKAFLLTGGSEPNLTLEIEMARLNWLCNGAPQINSETQPKVAK